MTEDKTGAGAGLAGPAGPGHLGRLARRWWAAWLAIAVMLAASIVLRLPAADDMYHNQDATWHVVHTMNSYNGIPASEHLFLPLVTPNEDARFIPWGATAADPNGIYYYTSFWSLGFAAPWAFAKLLGLAPGVRVLYAFSSLLYAGCTVAAAYIFAKLFGHLADARLVAVATAALYLFQPEIMQSQGAVYWHHSLNQLFLLLQFICYAQMGRRWRKGFFLVLCFLASITEWTGIVACGGYCLAFLLFGVPGDGGADTLPGTVWHKRLRMGERFLTALATGTAAILGLGATLFHFFLRLTPLQMYYNLSGSFGVRGSSTSDPLLQLFVMWFRSFRWFWPVLGVLGVLALVLPAARKALPGLLKRFLPILFVLTFPVLENFLLRQHTIEYSYARMKLVYPMLAVFWIFAACLWEQLKAWQKSGILRRLTPRLAAGALAAAVALCAVLNLANYLRRPNHYVSKGEWVFTNQAAVDDLMAEYPRQETLYGTNYLVRGYMNTLLQGGAWELTNSDTTLAKAREAGKRYAIFMDVGTGVSNTDRIREVWVYLAETGEELEHFTVG